ncbi:unnamed protein product [Penicillium olsonii]|uniref:Yeast cell wall synthesis Kre9/Knh1-like N-terminal domain-containing protein n=1 Tax=Penicillium olsonii TaxID=99116 RepID=A0A9W4I046_PENOL|nr:unnamed protein product [Penicillium olsonii]CAG8098752.1 unnamed protein product [Penicillium olsonii]CAG8181897.1 unnamed protein product [Penicillium olsonii]
MRFSVATSFSAFVALAAAYTTPDYSQNPTGNAITSPGLNEIVPEGKQYTIKWTPTTEGPISLVLLRGPSTNVQPLKTLAESIPNSGEFKWTPGSELTPDTTHYGLLLVVEGTGQYQYSTQFGLGAAAGASSGSGASTIEVTESTTICPETETAGPTATAKPSTVVAETTETTTFCPESETASAVSTPAWSTIIPSSEVTTTICPETETASATSIPVVVPTGVSPVTTKAWTSSARVSSVAPSGTASASPAASSPVFNGAASNTFSLGAVFAGLLVAFAI